VTATWTTIAALAVAAAIIRALGPALVGGRRMPPPVLALTEMLGPAVLAALVVTQTFSGSDRQLVLDARSVGVAAALVLLVFRARMLFVLLAAAVVTALVRAVA
jgi:branched-subunit amino acid transport protein